MDEQAGKEKGELTAWTASSPVVRNSIAANQLKF